MAIEGINVENWRAKPLKEVVNNMDVVEAEDSECAQWAQAMAAVADAPDNVTYDMAGGSTEEFTAQLEEITQKGLAPEGEAENGAPEDVEGVDKAKEAPAEEEKPEVGDKDETEDKPGDTDDAGAGAQAVVEKEKAEAATGAEPTEEEGEGEGDDITLADEALTTDQEEIRKRKIKKGEKPEEG